MSTIPPSPPPPPKIHLTHRPHRPPSPHLHVVRCSMVVNSIIVSGPLQAPGDSTSGSSGTTTWRCPTTGGASVPRVWHTLAPGAHPPPPPTHPTSVVWKLSKYLQKQASAPTHILGIPIWDKSVPCFAPKMIGKIRLGLFRPELQPIWYFHAFVKLSQILHF